MDFLSKVTDLFKSAPFRVLVVGTCLATSFLLFAPPQWLEVIGVKTFANDNRPLIGLAFVLSIALSISGVIFYVLDFAKNLIAKRHRISTRIQRLKSLTDAEKDLLKAYFLLNTRTQIFNDRDGVAMGLRKDGIIYLASTIGTYIGFPFNIENWAWEYLTKHQELLERKGPATHYAEGCTSALPKIIG
jgi:hypothetical protein